MKLTATTGEGIAALAAAIEEAGAGPAAPDPQARRRRRARYLIARAAADLVADRIRAGSGSELDKLADAVLAGTLLPTDAARTLIGR